MPRTTPVPGAVKNYLRKHHAVIDRATALKLTMTPAQIRAQIKAGRWQRVHPGVYCAHTGPLSRLSQLAAALAAVPGALALDALTAAELLGLRGFSDDRWIWVVVGHDRRVVAPKGVKVRRSTTMTDRSITERYRLPVVRMERAALSAALAWPKRDYGILTSCVQQGLTTADRLFGTLLGLGAIPGRARLRSIIGDAAGGTRSFLEGLFLRLARAAGLEGFERTYPLDLDGRRAWLDICIPALRIAIEIDGKAFHLMSEDWEKDLDRANEIVLDGWLLIRVTAKALRDEPDRVMDQVRRAIALRTAEMGASVSF